MFDILVLILSSIIAFTIIYFIFRIFFNVFLNVRNLKSFKQNTKEDSIVLLEKDIRDAKNTLYIYSGKCDEDTFNDERIEKAMAEKYRNLDIIVIIENDLGEENKVREYVEKGYIKKLFKTYKTYLYHFRIVDNKRVFIEKHQPGKDKDQREYLFSYNRRYIIQFKRIFFNIFKDNVIPIAA